MSGHVEKMIARTFLDIAQGLETGSFEAKPRIAVTGLGSEHGEAEVFSAALSAAKSGVDVTYIGTLEGDGVRTAKAENEDEAHKTMDQLRGRGGIDGAVTMHYPFPIGVSTVGRVATPGRGREIFLATTTGTSSTDRVEGMVKNAVYGIITAKACGIAHPTVGILNVDGARQTEADLKQLQENGYEPIWFSDLAHIEDYEKPVILTFDDGYDDNYTVLYPLLKKYQTKATIFVIGNAMGSQHKMTQEQVYELAASGLVSIQSHTYTHGNLSAMDEPALRQEMDLSNAALAAATGQIPYVLCYPEGKYSHLTMDVAKDYYTFALRMDGWTYQTGMDPYQVPRSFVSRRITLPDYLWFLAPSGKAS